MPMDWVVHLHLYPLLHEQFRSVTQAEFIY